MYCIDGNKVITMVILIAITVLKALEVALDATKQKT